MASAQGVVPDAPKPPDAPFPMDRQAMEFDDAQCTVNGGHDMVNGGQHMVNGGQDIEARFGALLEQHRDELFLRMDTWLNSHKGQFKLGVTSQPASRAPSPTPSSQLEGSGLKADSFHKDAFHTESSQVSSLYSPRLGQDTAELGTATSGVQKQARASISSQASTRQSTGSAGVQATGSMSSIRSFVEQSRSIRRPFASRLQGAITGTLRKSVLSMTSEHHRRIANSRSDIRKQSQGRGELEEPSAFVSLVKSWQFEALFAITIITNSVFIGAQVEYAATNLSEKPPLAISVIGYVYSILFLVELILRIVADGPQFFVNTKNLFWNYLDILIVASSLVEFSLEAAFLVSSSEVAEVSTSSNMRILRVVRITRLARVARVIKVIRFIRSLRALVQSILSTLKSLVWALFLLLLIIYVFAILFTDGVTSYRAERLQGSIFEPQNVQEVFLDSNFGSLHSSMHTLFRSIADGLDWDVAAQALQTVDWVWVYLFSAFVAFSCFAVLNVMTGVFCQGAIEGAQRDHDLLVHSMILDKQHNVSVMNELFEAIDEDGVGHLTLYDFESKFDDPNVKAFFSSLQLEPADAWTLFKLLDAEETGDVEMADFVEGCMKLKGPAKAIDIATLVHDSKFLKSKVKKLELSLGAITAQTGMLRNDLRAVIQAVNDSRQAQPANRSYDV